MKTNQSITKMLGMLLVSLTLMMCESQLTSESEEENGPLPEMECSEVTSGISANLQGNFDYVGNPFEMRSDDWFYRQSHDNETFGGPWVEECRDNKNGARYTILVGQVTQASTGVGYFLWKKIDKYFAFGAIVRNGRRYVCPSEATLSDSPEESRRLLKEDRTLSGPGSLPYLFDPSNPTGKSCFRGFNLSWTSY